MHRFHTLLFLLLMAAGLSTVGCGGGRGGGNSNDDDDSAGDDDDDDTTEPPADAELTAPSTPVGTCAGGIGQEFADTEPNDGIEWIQNLDMPDGGFCITGTIACGNDGSAFSNDLDLYGFQVAAAETADFVLAWADSNGDMDFTLYDADGGTLHEFEEGGDPETGSGLSLVPGVQYFVRVGCWEGSDKQYQLNATWGAGR